LRFEIAKTAVFEVMQVRTANTDRPDTHLDFAGTRIFYVTISDSELVVIVVLSNAHVHFLKRLSNAVLASLGVRMTGAGIFAPGPAGPFPEPLAPSRDTVTRGLNNSHSFVWSL
jgi:hypothetical protein